MAFNQKNTFMKKICVLLFLLIPAVIAFLTLISFHDAIITMLALILYYVLAIQCYKATIEEWRVQYKREKDNLLFSHNRSIGVQTMLCYGLVFGLLLVLWSLFVKWGPKEFKLPFPAYGKNFWSWAYYVAFAVIFIGYCLAEHLFFNFFGYSEINEQTNREVSYEDEKLGFFALICVLGAYGLLCFAVLITIAKGFGAVLIMVGICVLMGFVLIMTRLKSGILVSNFSRIAFALAVLIWLFYLSKSPEWWRRKSPVMYQGYHEKNIWKKS